MNVKYTLISILASVGIGGVISVFSSLRWSAATCFVVAALFINGALAEWEDLRPGGFDNPDGSATPPPAGPTLVTVALAVAALLVGAWVQAG